MLKVNDYIMTPRFCTVRINEIFQTAKEAHENGYAEPTYYSYIEEFFSDRA